MNAMRSGQWSIRLQGTERARGGLLHVRGLTVLLRSGDSTGAERQGRHLLETRGSGAGQCLQQDDHGQKAKRPERVLCFSETASSPKSWTVQLEEYMKGVGIKEINS